MTFENDEARKNFLKYAFTSIDKEHKIPEGYRNSVLNDLTNGERVEDIEELLFLTGVINCQKLSKMNGNEKISKDVTDRYFLGPHNEISDCKAYIGNVTKVNRKSVRIETPQGNKLFKNILEPNLEIGDSAIVHGDYVIKVLK